MARKPRKLETNLVYHVFNRRTDRQLLFPSPRSFDDFLHLMELGRERYDVRICAYCIMDTHWHQAVWVHPEAGATAVASYVRWLSATHAIRFRIRSDTRGLGHVYQDRYKAIAAYDINHYLTVVRYIERNPLEARIVQRAEHWSWSSLSDRLSGRRKILCEGPVPLPPNWLQVVNTQSTLEELDGLEDIAPL